MSEPDLLHHYKVLKQFLDILDDLGQRAKSTSSRAMRAREKLLKLLSAQFRELSTDVYDELKRRIDESRAEPDFLLPKLTFHPKRNQARQKLSLLPQTRFKDLVLDISYEISRRNLHIPSDSTGSVSGQGQGPQSPVSYVHQKTPSHAYSQSLYQQHSKGGSIAESADLNRVADEDISHLTVNDTPREAPDDSIDDLQVSHEDTSKQTIAVQPTTVIPTKANLTWSSDEEEEDESKEVQQPAQREVVEHSNGSRSLDVEIDELKRSLQASEERAEQLEKTNEDLKTNLATTLSQKDALEAEHKQHLAKSANSVDPKELSALRDELESLKSSSAALRLENQALKNKHWKDSRHQSRDLANLSREDSLSSHLNSSPGHQGPRSHSGSLTQAVEAVSRSQISGSPNQSPPRSAALPTSTTDMSVNEELKKLHDKLQSMDASHVPVSVSKKEQLLRAEVAKWQQRYQESQAGIIKKNILSSEPRLRQNVSPDGVIPLKLAAQFFAAIETFITSVYDDDSDQDVLFEKMSHVACLANKLALASDRSSSYEHEHLATNAREAASHSLTATRYYGSNSKLLPRVLVERSVDELAFTVCDLVSACKLNDGNGDGELAQASQINQSQVQESNDAIRPLKIGKSTNLSPPAGKDRSANSRGVSPMEDYSTPRLHTLSKESLKPVKNETHVDTPSPARILPGSLPMGESSDQVDKEPQEEEPVKKLSMFERLARSRAEETKPATPEKEKKSIDLDKSNGVAKAGAAVAATGAAATAATSATPATESSSAESKDRSLTELNKKSNAVFESDKANADVKPDFEKNPSQNKENLAPSTPHSASRVNILDKVRQFESPEENSSNKVSSKTKSPSLMSVKNAKELLSKDASAASSPNQLSPASQKTAENTPTRSRSLFQTLRNKFAGEPKDEEDKTTPLKNERKKETSEDVKPSKAVEPYESVKSKLIDANQPENAAKPELKETTDHFTDESVLKATGAETASKAAVGLAAGAASFAGAKKAAESIKKLEEKPTESIKRHDEKIGEGIKKVEEKPTVDETPKVDRDLDTKKEQVPAGSSTGSSEKGEVGLKQKPSLKSLSSKSPSFKVKKVNYSEKKEEESEEESDYDEQEEEARQRQEYRKSMAAATFNFDLFDIDDPDNTLTQVLLYLEHQTVQVISTIQDLLTAIKKPDATRGELRENSKAISEVIRQMAEATKTSMNQTRNYQLKEHGSWVVTSLEDCNHRMNNLCRPNADKSDEEFADKNFKQRLAGISFDIAKCTKELVKTVEEASLKEDIAQLDARLNQPDDDLT